MALAETAELAVKLSLDDSRFSNRMGRINKALGATGKHVGIAARNLAKLGAVAAGAAAGLGVLAIRSGIDSLATLENATTSVTGAIKQMGLAGRVTAAQVAQWANEIEAATDAAFDDKDITAATSTLIRYGKVAPQNLRKAMEVMTDLAAKTGDVGSASEKLARALADPTKATRILREAGITLTKAQDDQIKRLVKQGKLQKAQALLLKIVEERTKGAAAASKGEYADALNKLNDAWEDVTRAIAVGFLPVITEAADWLTKTLADEKNINKIREIGRGLAGAARKALEFVQTIPWDRVGKGLETAWGFAEKLIGVFTGLPPEVQGTIIALAGLDRLSGGAISGIVSELGKGLIKGVLGITAGVVNINAATVRGGGGVSGGTAPAAGGGAGLLQTVGAGAAGAAGATAIAAAAKEITDSVQSLIGGTQEQQSALTKMFEQIRVTTIGPGETIRAILAGEAPGKLQQMVDQLGRIISGEPTRYDRDLERASLEAYRQGEKTMAAKLDEQGARESANQARLQAAVQTSGARVAETVRNKDLSVTVNVPAPRVSISNVITGTRTTSRVTKNGSYLVAS